MLVHLYHKVFNQLTDLAGGCFLNRRGVTPHSAYFICYVNFRQIRYLLI